MASLDGLLMRLRIAGGALSADLAFLLADAIEAAGGEGIELSQRGNMQICGLSQAGWRQILAILTSLGAIDDDEPAEAMRNILCSPLAGLDLLAVRDIRADVAGLARALTALSARYRLPAKFSWIVEDGGALSLADVDADLRFLAVPDGWALGVGRRDGVAWFAGSDDPAAMARRWTPVLARRWPGRRLRDLSVGDLAALTVSLQPIAAPPQRAPGVVPGRRIAGGVELLSVGLPFGRLTHAGLRLLARLARDHGVGELRLTPWRQIILPAINRVPDGIDWQGADLLIDDDPLLSCFSCRGSGYCPQALAPVRPLARRLAALNALPGRRLHVSGCAKGCAHPAAADVTLVACVGGFGLVRRGRAKDSPCRTVTAETLLERSFWKAMAQDD